MDALANQVRGVRSNLHAARHCWLQPCLTDTLEGIMFTKNRWFHAGLWIAAAAALVGWSSQAVAQDAPASATSQVPGAAMSQADQGYLVAMARANLAEVAAAKVALSKAHSDNVRQFAQRMVADHGQALRELQHLASHKGVSLPTEPDQAHQRAIERLGGLSGDAFDRRYMAASGIREHRKTHQLLQRIQARASDPELKALAARMAPTVDQHLATLQQFNADHRDGSGAAGTSGTGGTTGAGHDTPAPEKPTK